jgi:hypothetical protein
MCSVQHPYTRHSSPTMRITAISPHVKRAAKAFIADKSEHRNISKGQKAMRIALLWPQPEKGGRGKKGKAAETAGFNAYSRELAISVRDGTTKLDEALKEVKAAREALNSQGWKLVALNDAVEQQINDQHKSRRVVDWRARLEERGPAFFYVPRDRLALAVRTRLDFRAP